MNNENNQQPTPSISPVEPSSQVQPVIGSQQSFNSSKGSLDGIQDALKSIHSAGTWAIVLGLLNIVLTPLLESVVYTQASSKGYSETTSVITALIIGLIVGGIFIGLGIRLKRTHEDRVLKADRTLLWLVAAIAVVMILSLIDGGHGVGLLNLLVLFEIAQARGKIKKLKKEGAI